MQAYRANWAVITGMFFWVGLPAQLVFADIIVVKPHPHDPPGGPPGFVHFEEDGTPNGDDDHNHVFPHSVQGSAGAGHVHDAFSVWTNRTYHFDVGAATIGAGLEDDFWHGFIVPGMEPRYKFIDGTGANKTFDATSKGIISDGVSEWVAKATAAAALRTTPNGTALETGIGLVATLGAAFEIRIGFFDALVEQRSALAEWLVSDEQIWAGSGLAAADLDTSPILAFDDDINWLFDTSKTPAGTQFDFATIALHELGHVFGLLHAPGAATQAGNIMQENIQAEARDGKTLRFVDNLGSANAVAELYSQPVPEPSALALFGMGVILIGGRMVRKYPSKNDSEGGITK